tara:strand:+ start:5604 stop:6203 length:600 start_codon:yes stop_codon:yes gene_type:complete
MTLQNSGPISFGDINDELGNNTTDTLDLRSASASFSLTTPDSMDEFYGLSLDPEWSSVFGNFSFSTDYSSSGSSFDISTDKTAVLTNGTNGTTTISCGNPVFSGLGSNVGNMRVRVSTSPIANGTTNSSNVSDSVSISLSSSPQTLYMRFYVNFPNDNVDANYYSGTSTITLSNTPSGGSTVSVTRTITINVQMDEEGG